MNKIKYNDNNQKWYENLLKLNYENHSNECFYRIITFITSKNAIKNGLNTVTKQ